MADAALHYRELLQNHLIEIIGEAVEGKETSLRRSAAREILKRDNIFYNLLSGQDALVLLIEMGDLQCRLASPSTGAAGFLKEKEPYPADGILFSALVHLLRVEDDLFAWGWLPEQVRDLGLAMNPDEELAWPITRHWVSIKDRDGQLRIFPRFSS